MIKIVVSIIGVFMLILLFLTKCKHEWEVNGWTYVKCKKCGYSKRSEKEASKLINEVIKHMPPECEPWKVKARL